MPACTSSAAAARRVSAPFVHRCSPVPAPAARSWSRRTACPSAPPGSATSTKCSRPTTSRPDRSRFCAAPDPSMFGASAVHGVINLITPTVHSLPTFTLGLDGGSDSFSRIAFATSHESEDSERGFGAYGVATSAPGWRDSSGVDEAKLNLLGDLDVGGGQLRLRAAGTVLNQETAGFIQGYNSYLDEDIARTNPNPEAFRDASSARVSAKFPAAGRVWDRQQPRARRHLSPFAHGFPATLPDRQTARAQRADQLHAERHRLENFRQRSPRGSHSTRKSPIPSSPSISPAPPGMARPLPTRFARRAFTMTTRWTPGRSAQRWRSTTASTSSSRPPPRCAPTRLTTTTTTT